jgi:hypothetical protein
MREFAFTDPVYSGFDFLSRAVVNEPPTVLIEPAAPHWDEGAAMRPVDRPLAWVGDDRLLLDDVSRCGIKGCLDIS